MNQAPYEEVGESFNHTFESLLSMAQGTYPNGRLKEGIVIKSNVPIETPEGYKKRIILKVLNNQALLKEA